MDVSIVVPIFNEEQNISLLCRSIHQAMARLGCAYEMVLVNDGSTDNSAVLLDELAEEDPQVLVVHLCRNFGQTAAISAGLDHARGDIIVTMDADLQNDPEDIGSMLAKLNEGFDLVHGWRRRRRDPFLTRRVPSMIANWLIARVTGFPVRDLGCTLKVMRRQVATGLKLYGEMHRFIPILAHWQGARCVEIEINHHPRRFGQTKYGLSRTYRVILDLITVKYLIQFSTSPMRLFGSIGFGCATMAVFGGVGVLAMKLMSGVDITGNPLLYVSLFGCMLGLQFISLGMLGEMNARIYHESQGRKPYAVRDTVGAGRLFQPRVLRRTA